MGNKLPKWSKQPIETIIDREFGVNTQLRDGMSAYKTILDAYILDKNDQKLTDSLLDHAGAVYRAAGRPLAPLYHFADVRQGHGIVFLFDMELERTVFVKSVSRSNPGNRDKDYHDDYPSAGLGNDKGHAMSSAQGGFEGGPNYFGQAPRLNRGHSESGKLWRTIERYLAANSGLPCFVHLIYAYGNKGFHPDEMEYGLLSVDGQFRVAAFPNNDL